MLLLSCWCVILFTLYSCQLPTELVEDAREITPSLTCSAIFLELSMKYIALGDKEWLFWQGYHKSISYWLSPLEGQAQLIQTLFGVWVLYLNYLSFCVVLEAAGELTGMISAS